MLRAAGMGGRVSPLFAPCDRVRQCPVIVSYSPAIRVREQGPASPASLMCAGVLSPFPVEATPPHSRFFKEAALSPATGVRGGGRQSMNTTDRTETAEANVLPSIRVRVAFVSPEAEALYGGLPARATARSVGTDLRAVFAEEAKEILPGERLAVPTGLRVQPEGAFCAGFIYSRSGLGARDGVTVAQGVGVVDPDYTGEVIVVLLNTSGSVRRIGRGERVAQLIFQPCLAPEFIAVPDLDETERGAGGFGHTGR